MLTADEEVGGCAGEEHRAPSQGADQSADATKQQQNQAERKDYHYGTVYVCKHTHTHKSYSMEHLWDYGCLDPPNSCSPNLKQTMYKPLCPKASI